MRCLTDNADQRDPEKRRGWLVLVPCCCALVACSEAKVRANSDATISTNASQTIKGWGLYPSDGLSAEPASIQTAIYSSTGINFARFRIPPEAGNSDGTINTAELAPFLSDMEAATNHGCTNFFICLWSPPAYMKLPYQSTLGNDNGELEYLNPAYETNFVEYLTNVLGYYHKFLPLPIAISIQQEPNVAPPEWDGCDYTNEPSVYLQVVKDLRAALDAVGMNSVIIIGPEVQRLQVATNFLEANFAILNTDTNLSAALAAYASHTYVTTGWQDYLNGLTSHPKDCWMTEYSVSGEPDNISWSLNVVERLMSDVIDIPNNYWFWWRGWRDVSSGYDGEELITTTNNINFTTNGLYYIFSRLWNSTPAPCQVYKLSTDDPNLYTAAGSQGPWDDMVAFRNTNLNTLVVLIANPTSTSKVFNLHQCDAGNQANYYRSDASDNMVWQGTLPIIAGNVTNLPIPGNSITIVVCGSATNTATQIGYLDGPSPIYYGATLSPTAFTVSSSNTVLVVFIAYRCQGSTLDPGIPTGVEWNGNPLTLASSGNTHANTYDYNLIYYLTNPPPGSGLVTATLSNIVSQTWWMAYTLTNVNIGAALLTNSSYTSAGATINNAISGVPANGWASVNTSTTVFGAGPLITATGGTVLMQYNTASENCTVGMGSVADLPVGSDQFTETSSGSSSKLVLVEAIFAPASGSSSPLIQSPAVIGGNFTLQVNSLAGLNYVLQTTTHLAPTNWIGIQTNPGGGVLTFTNAINGTNRQQFFRIQVQ